MSFPSRLSAIESVLKDRFIHLKTNIFVILSILASLTLYRSLFFLIFPDSNFNSDGAVMGIMANDITHLRHLPSTFYGQKYLLGIEAYLAVPFFLLFGSSIVSLKLPLFLMNFIFVYLLFYILYKDLKVSSLASGLVTLMVAMAPLRPGIHMMMPDGANIEPYIYVLLTWILRRKTYLLGFLLALFYWQREFSLLGFLALITTDIYMFYGNKNEVKKVLFSRFLTFCTGLASYRFLAFFISKSPTYYGSGAPRGAFSFENVYENILWLFNEALFNILGFSNGDLEAGGLLHPITPLYEPLLFPLKVIFIFLLLHALFRIWKSRSITKKFSQAEEFGYFLIAVGVLNFLVTALFLKERNPTILRYNLLFLFFPIGVILWNLKSHVRIHKFLALIFIVIWSLSNLIGYHNLYKFYSSLPTDKKFELVKFLEQKKIKYAKVPYWDAYYLTFISQEQLKVASSDHVRIGWLQDVVNKHEDEAALIKQTPCAEGKEISQFYKWFICHF